MSSTEPNDSQRSAEHGLNASASVSQTGKLRAPRILLTRAPHPHIFWHRELPPADAEPIDEHIIEATSYDVSHSLEHRDELWDRCYGDLMAQAQNRLEQEIGRLGGCYAHVLDEHVETQSDPVMGKTRLKGRFRYVLYGRPTIPKTSSQKPH